MEAERRAFEAWVRKMFVCSEHSFVRAHPYGYINTVSSQTFEGRVQPSYADVQMLWETWLGRAALGVRASEPLKCPDEEAFRQFQRDRIAEAQRHDAEQAKPSLACAFKCGWPAKCCVHATTGVPASEDQPKR